MNLTIPFYEMIDEESEAWSLVDKTTFPHLFPTGVESLSEDMQDNIREHFYYRQIGFSSPTRFLRHFYRLIKERANTWARLLATETALRNDDMIYNYDLTEESTDTHESSNTIEVEGSNSNTRAPNLTSTTTDGSTSTSKRMDTPDGITSDIDNYLTAAEKDTENSTGTTTQTGTESNVGTNNSTTESSYTDEINKTLTRKGNIGVMTAAQILGGYREAQAWDTYTMVIFPELEQLFVTTVDLDDIDLW